MNILYGQLYCSDHIHCRERISSPSEANLSDFVSYICVMYVYTCLPTWLILDDGCLIAVYFLLCIVCDIYYLLGNYMSSVTDGSVHTVNTYTCMYVHSCVCC